MGERRDTTALDNLKVMVGTFEDPRGYTIVCVNLADMRKELISARVTPGNTWVAGYARRHGDLTRTWWIVYDWGSRGVYTNTIDQLQETYRG